jgi:Fe-S-cluster containining protein
MSDLIRQDGFDYAFAPSACERCEGRCCTGESGNIFVSPLEIAVLAKHLKMDEGLFRSTYLVKRGYSFSLKEQIVGMSHDCIFFDRKINGCGVYEARPTQCRTFPFWDYFKTHRDELKRECPGIADV